MATPNDRSGWLYTNHRENSCNFNSFRIQRKRRNCQSYIVNKMPADDLATHGVKALASAYGRLVGLRPVIQILCHVLARGRGRWLRYFTEAKAEVKYRASARIRGPKHVTRFEWPVSILIMTRHPFLPFKTHKTSAKNPRLLTITGAIWFCRYRQCTPSQLWMHPTCC